MVFIPAIAGKSLGMVKMDAHHGAGRRRGGASSASWGDDGGCFFQRLGGKPPT